MTKTPHTNKVTLEGVKTSVDNIQTSVDNIQTTLQEFMTAVTNMSIQNEQRFIGIDDHFVNIDKHFVDINKRFMDIDKRFADIDKRFDTIESSMATKIDLAEFKTQMVTKSYLDIRLSTMEGNIINILRKEDKKTVAVVNLLKDKKVFSPQEAKNILSLEPFAG
ncbi:MAG: hypothetical protein WCV88_01185 [Patescibacteria group bacterium]|jgi:hypothetical protein